MGMCGGGISAEQQAQQDETAKKQQELLDAQKQQLEEQRSAVASGQQAATSKAQAAATSQAKARQGFQSTILTTPLGAEGPGNVKRKTLLGA